MRTLGTFLFAVGILWLMDNLGWFSEIAWDVVWPVIFIVVGIWFVLKSGKSCTCSSLCKIGGICHGKCAPCHGETPVKANVPKK
jgi:hypothetical protein